MQTESKMSLLRQEGHNEDMLSNANWYFYAMLIEFSLFLGIMWFQQHNVKTSLDNRLAL